MSKTIGNGKDQRENILIHHLIADQVQPLNKSKTNNISAAKQDRKSKEGDSNNDR